MDFSPILISFVDIKDFFTGSVCGNNQSDEVFTDFKILCRSEPNYVYETYQSTNLIDLF